MRPRAAWLRSMRQFRVPASRGRRRGQRAPEKSDRFYGDGEVSCGSRRRLSRLGRETPVVSASRESLRSHGKELARLVRLRNLPTSFVMLAEALLYLGEVLESVLG